MEKTKKQLSGLFVFLKSRGRIWILLGGVVAGIVLILIGSSLGGEEKEQHESATGESLADLQAYTEALEKELETMCSAVAGVGQVDVMVRLASGTSVIYAEDGSGKPVTVGSGSSQSPLYATVRAPTVSGVGIVCRGGNDPEVQRKLVQLVSTTLDISASRVYVTGK